MISSAGSGNGNGRGQRREKSGNEGHRKATGLLVSQKERGGCCHYWVVGFPYGPSSGAKCRICGKKRQFSNRLRLCDDASRGSSWRRYSAHFGSDVRWQRGSYPVPSERYDRSLAQTLVREMELGSRW